MTHTETASSTQKHAYPLGARVAVRNDKGYRYCAGQRGTVAAHTSDSEQGCPTYRIKWHNVNLMTDSTECVPEWALSRID